jgi:hypothetical protein
LARETARAPKKKTSEKRVNRRKLHSWEVLRGWAAFFLEGTFRQLRALARPGCTELR